MASSRHGSNSTNFSLERKAYLIATALTNDLLGFSLPSNQQRLDSIRGSPTILKLNHKRLAWGDKSVFESHQLTDTRVVPYRSVELNYVCQMFRESAYPNVLLCAIRISSRTKYDYEIFAFRLQNEHEVRIFLDLFASITSMPVSADFRKVKIRDRDRAIISQTSTFDRNDLYSPPSLTLVHQDRSSSVKKRMHVPVTLPAVVRSPSIVSPTRPVSGDYGNQARSVRRRRRENHDTIESRVLTNERSSQNRGFAEQSKTIFFSDGGESSPTMTPRSEANRNHHHHSRSHQHLNGSLTAKSFSSPSIPDADYTVRATVGHPSVPSNDDFDVVDSTRDGVARSGPNLDRRTTLVDNGIVKVTVEEYQDGTDDRIPEMSSNDYDTSSHGSKPYRSVNDPLVSQRNSHRTANYHVVDRHSHRSRKADTVDQSIPLADPYSTTSPPIRSTELTASVRKVFNRPAIQRSLSESGKSSRDRRGTGSVRKNHSEIPLNDSEGAYQSRPVQRQRTVADDIYQSRSSVVRNQPIRTRPESVYQSRSTSSIRRQPISHIPENVYQSRSSVSRHQPTSVVADPVYQSRQIKVGHIPERRVTSGPIVHHESRNDYEWWESSPAQINSHSNRNSVYYLDRRTSRR